MGKFDTDEIGKPGKPPKYRRFPWRLWLWALVMTAAAGAGGYFTWFFKNQVDDAKANEVESLKRLGAQEKTLGERTAEATECVKKRDDAVKESTSCKAREAPLIKDLKTTREQIDTLNAQAEQTKIRLEAIDAIQKQFAKMIDTGALKITARRGSLVISLPAEVLFASGVSDLSEEGKVKVLEVGFALKPFKDRRFLVVGHSDNQPLKGSVFKDNWELSTARALTVTRVLVQSGMDPKNLIPAGAGENDPIAANTSVKDLARNRRIEIALLPAINELPPLPASLTDSKPADSKTDPKPADPKK